jgi:hypothetical protein
MGVESGTVALDGIVVRGDEATTQAVTDFAQGAIIEPVTDTAAKTPIDVDGLDCSPIPERDGLCAQALPRPAGLTRVSNDSWRGWPVRPLHKQHPVRGSFLDPRPGGFHFGIDISVRDDRPERGAPPGRTHRVYAVESGTVSNVIDSGSPCVLRRLWVGHFAYYHVDAAVASGQHVSAGQMLGWTCRGQWHVHLSEVTAGNVLVNPLHRGGKLNPYTDTEAPVIKRIAFYRVAPPLWTNPGGWMWVADDRDTSLARWPQRHRRRTRLDDRSTIVPRLAYRATHPLRGSAPIPGGADSHPRARPRKGAAPRAFQRLLPLCAPA